MADILPIKRSYKILIAEDDPDDQILLREAFEYNGITDSLYFVENGEAVLQYLASNVSQNIALPELIILDLNLPKKDGREVLRELKNNEVLCVIPVVILTTSSAKEEIVRLYQMGANSYIVKPYTFTELVEISRNIINFWLSTACLPTKFMFYAKSLIDNKEFFTGYDNIK
jgi:two-component system response regulator